MVVTGVLCSAGAVQPAVVTRARARRRRGSPRGPTGRHRQAAGRGRLAQAPQHRNPTQACRARRRHRARRNCSIQAVRYSRGIAGDVAALVSGRKNTALCHIEQVRRSGAKVPRPDVEDVGKVATRRVSGSRIGGRTEETRDPSRQGRSNCTRVGGLSGCIRTRAGPQGVNKELVDCRGLSVDRLIQAAVCGEDCRLQCRYLISGCGNHPCGRGCDGRALGGHRRSESLQLARRIGQRFRLCGHERHGRLLIAFVRVM